MHEWCQRVLREERPMAGVTSLSPATLAVHVAQESPSRSHSSCSRRRVVPHAAEGRPKLDRNRNRNPNHNPNPDPNPTWRDAAARGRGRSAGSRERNAGEVQHVVTVTQQRAAAHQRVHVPHPVPRGRVSEDNCDMRLPTQPRVSKCSDAQSTHMHTSVKSQRIK